MNYYHYKGKVYMIKKGYFKQVVKEYADKKGIPIEKVFKQMENSKISSASNIKRWCYAKNRDLPQKNKDGGISYVIAVAEFFNIKVENFLVEVKEKQLKQEKVKREQIEQKKQKTRIKKINEEIEELNKIYKISINKKNIKNADDLKRLEKELEEEYGTKEFMQRCAEIEEMENQFIVGQWIGYDEKEKKEREPNIMEGFGFKG